MSLGQASVGRNAEALTERLSWASEGAGGTEEALSAMLAVLRAVLPCNRIVWNAVDLDFGDVTVVHSDDVDAEAGKEMARLLLDVADDHPMISSYLAPGQENRTEPRRMSDVVTTSELRRTRAWTDLLHPYHADFQLTILTGRVGRSGSCWTFNRTGRDFTDDELALACRLQPALTELSLALVPRRTTVPDHRRDDRAGSRRHPLAGERLLTDRERQVLDLTARGFTAVSTARVLRISARTVHKHLEHVYGKLACHDRLLAVDRARRLGLLTDGAHRDSTSCPDVP